MIPRNFKFLLLLMAGFVIAANASAEITSTNYKLSGRFTAGTGNAISANYDIVGGSLIQFEGATPSSTNYALGGEGDVLGTANVAKIDSSTPANYSFFFDDESADYTVNATDPDSDSLQYKAYQDGTLKDGAQASNNLVWTLSSSDFGRREVELQVVDPDGTVAKVQSMYVVRRPVK